MATRKAAKKMDFDEDLLPSLLPERNASDPLTEAYELMQILERHFQSAKHEDGANQVLYPRTEPHALRAVFGRNGQLNGIFAGPGLTNADLEAIRDRAGKEISETTGLAVAREVLFSSAQVEGWWKYKDVFQILPIPPSAPRAPMLLAAHPFLLEFRFQQASDGLVNAGRRARQAWKLHLLLNALLDPGVTWGGSKVIGTSGRSWVR